MFTSAYAIFFLVSSVFGADEHEAKLRFYHDSIDHYTELSLDEAFKIFSSSWYSSNKTTMIFCHGFTGIGPKYFIRRQEEMLPAPWEIKGVSVQKNILKSPNSGYPKGSAVTSIVKAYLDQGLSNVALLNWDRLAAAIYNGVATSYFNWAVPNAIKLAATFADTLLSLSKAGMDLNKTHLIGHSLGAHVMGIAGYKVMERNGVILPWITGLDPAGVYFDRRRPWERLNPQSARFVDVIHSDPSKYGSSRSLGTVDFWPNFRVLGNVQQPGCDSQNQLESNSTCVLKDLCNHNRCWQFLLDAMKYPGTIMGSYAKTYRIWKSYNKEQKLATVLEIGRYEPNAVPGDYYLLTADASPFGLGEDGL